jgi:hypothetical protein
VDVGSILSLRPDNGFQRFHTASAITGRSLVHE